MQAESKQEKLAFSAAEAAQALSISKPTLYQLCKRADFPAFRIGGRLVVSSAGLAAWVERQTQQTEVNT